MTEKPIRNSPLAGIRRRQFERHISDYQARFSRPACDVIDHLPDARYGTLVYSTRNFGDEIQTLAQLGFLPRAQEIVAIDRERLNRYAGPPTRLITNGWYLHNVKNWPPAANIDPIFVSFHWAESWDPTSEGLDYLRRHAPIGCRDLSTMNRLQAHGVDAYFSGCLTLTLQNPHAAEERSGVVICDAQHGYDGGYPPSARTMMNRLVPKHIVQNATVMEQECPKRMRFDFAGKTQRALDALEMFARAKLVITTRLHCALPCRALGTPVIFLHENYHGDPRFEGLRPALQGYGPDATSIDVDWDNPQPVDISDFRQRVTTATLDAISAKWHK